MSVRSGFILMVLAAVAFAGAGCKAEEKTEEQVDQSKILAERDSNQAASTQAGGDAGIKRQAQRSGQAGEPADEALEEVAAESAGDSERQEAAEVLKEPESDEEQETGKTAKYTPRPARAADGTQTNVEGSSKQAEAGKVQQQSDETAGNENAIPEAKLVGQTDKTAEAQSAAEAEKSEVAEKPDEQVPAAEENSKPGEGVAAEAAATQTAEPAEGAKADAKAMERQESEPNSLAACKFYEETVKLLEKYVDKDGKVNYELLRRKRGDLSSIFRGLGNITFKQYDSWSRQDQLALWINAYNLCTLRVVIENYPISPSRIMVLFGYPPNSIMQISNPWTKYEYEIMGEAYTLREIERGIIFQLFDEPRAALALCNATAGGPALRHEPYTGEKLDEQLDDQADLYLSSERGLRINRDRRIVQLSAIFKDSWYGQHFVSKYGTKEKFAEHSAAQRAVLNFATRYVSRRDREMLMRKDYSIEYIEYDWHLNEQ